MVSEGEKMADSDNEPKKVELNGDELLELHKVLESIKASVSQLVAEDHGLSGREEAIKDELDSLLGQLDPDQVRERLKHYSGTIDEAERVNKELESLTDKHVMEIKGLKSEKSILETANNELSSTKLKLESRNSELEKALRRKKRVIQWMKWKLGVRIIFATIKNRWVVNLSCALLGAVLAAAVTYHVAAESDKKMDMLLAADNLRNLKGRLSNSGLSWNSEFSDFVREKKWNLLGEFALIKYLDSSANDEDRFLALSAAGLGYYFESKYVGADTIWTMCHELRPDSSFKVLISNARIKSVLNGRMADQRQLLESAMVLLDSAILSDSGFTDAYLNRGVAVFYLGDTLEAARMFLRAGQLEPGHRRAEENLKYIPDSILALASSSPI